MKTIKQINHIFNIKLVCLIVALLVTTMIVNISLIIGIKAYNLLITFVLSIIIESILILK